MGSLAFWVLVSLFGMSFSNVSFANGPLQEAIKEGDINAVLFLLQEGADLNTLNDTERAAFESIIMKQAEENFLENYKRSLPGYMGPQKEKTADLYKVRQTPENRLAIQAMKQALPYANPSDPFETMVEDVNVKIMNCLSPAQVCSLNQVSKKWNKVVQNQKVKQRVYDEEVDRIFTAFSQAVRQGKNRTGYIDLQAKKPLMKAARNLLMAWRFASDLQKAKLRPRLIELQNDKSWFIRELIKAIGDRDFIPLLIDTLFADKDANIFINGGAKGLLLDSLQALSNMYPDYHRAELVANLEQLLSDRNTGIYVPSYLLGIDSANEKALDIVRKKVERDQFYFGTIGSSSTIEACNLLLRHNRKDELALKVVSKFLDVKDKHDRVEVGTLLLNAGIYSPALSVITKVLSSCREDDLMGASYLRKVLYNFSQEGSEELARAVRMSPDSELAQETYRFLSGLKHVANLPIPEGYGIYPPDREGAKSFLAQFGQDL